MTTRRTSFQLPTPTALLLISFYILVVLVSAGVVFKSLSATLVSAQAIVSPTSTPPPTTIPVLAEFLNRFDSLQTATAQFWIAMPFTNAEVNGIAQAGEFNASPLVALTQQRGDCFELAGLAALFGQEKYAYPPLILILIPASPDDPVAHAIYVFEQSPGGLWGYVDNFTEYRSPHYADVFLLARDYIDRHPIPSGRYRNWLLLDLSLLSADGIDWQTTQQSIPIDETDIVEHGHYPGG